MSDPNFFEMKVDSGASANFHEESHHLPQNATSKSDPFVSIIVPNGQITTSKSTTNLPLPLSSLPPSVKISHGFPSLASVSLLSVGQICDHKCTAIFANCSIKMYNNNDVKIQENNLPILAGTQNAPSQLLYNFILPIPDPVQQYINILQPETANATNIPHIQ